MQINKINRTELKERFSKNAIPTETDFHNFIDANLNQAEDGLVKLPGNPVSIQAEGDSQSTQKLLNFYSSFVEDNPTWSINQNPRLDNARPDTAQAGLSINDAGGHSRLFIDSATGKVGLGTLQPQHTLDVNGSVRGSLLVNSGMDFVLGNGDNGRGNSGLSRALVKDSGATLVLNYANDFGGGTRIGSSVKINANGNTGVGEGNPQQKLVVRGNANSGKVPESGMSGAGSLAIVSNAPQIDFIDTEHNDWSIHVNGNKMYFVRQPWNYNDLVLDGAGKVGVGTDAPGYTLDVNGTVRLGGFTTEEKIEWPNIVWCRDTAKGWDEGIIKGAAGHGAWGRSGYGIHMHESRHFGFYSTNFDTLFDVEGKTGRAYIKGNTGIADSNPQQKLVVRGNYNAGKVAENNMQHGGVMAIVGNTPQLDFIDVDNNDWSIHVNSNKLYFIRQPWNHNDLVLDGAGNIGMGTSSPTAKLSLGTWNGGESGVTAAGATQLLLSGAHNAGVNQGHASGTYKLKIEGYNNDGTLVYPIYVMDENSKVDFFIRNRPSASDVPRMFFAGHTGIGAENQIGDALEITRNWFDSNTNSWGGGIRLKGTAPSISFWETDNGSHRWMWHLSGDRMNLYRRPAGGSWENNVQINNAGNLNVRGKVTATNTRALTQQQVHRRPIWGMGYQGRLHFSTSWVKFTHCYGPFSYAIPAVQPGATRKYRLYAVYSDNQTNTGEIVIQFNFTGGHTRQFKLPRTWGGGFNSAWHRDAVSDWVDASGVNTNHAEVFIRLTVGGKQGDLVYLEIQSYDFF